MFKKHRLPAVMEKYDDGLLRPVAHKRRSDPRMDTFHADCRCSDEVRALRLEAFSPGKEEIPCKSAHVHCFWMIDDPK